MQDFIAIKFYFVILTYIYTIKNIMTIKNLKKISSELQNAFLQLNTKEDMFAFLRDLMTEDEIMELSLRLDIAKRLRKWNNYKQIEKETWASSTTIARVSKFLHWEFGGYKKIFSKNN